MVFFRTDDEEEEVETPEDEDAALADDVLDEVESDDVVAPDELEGFGLMDEAAALAVEEKEEPKEGEEEGDAPLEEDAEDVDFDTFDDVDEM
jgi:hypothetical protein